jgi:hypothetical protein
MPNLTPPIGGSTSPSVSNSGSNISNLDRPPGQSRNSDALTPAEIAEFQETSGRDLPSERLQDPEARHAVREYLKRSKDPQKATEDIFTEEQSIVPRERDFLNENGTNDITTGSTDEKRFRPGVAEGGENLPDTDRLLLDNQESSRTAIGRIPGQIARRMQGMHFDSFREFRETFWKFVAQDLNLTREGWSAGNLDRMQRGLAPYAPGAEQTGGGSNSVLQLDHSHDLQHGGGVYDLDSIRIVTPRFHREYGN